MIKTYNVTLLLNVCSLLSPLQANVFGYDGKEMRMKISTDYYLWNLFKKNTHMMQLSDYLTLHCLSNINSVRANRLSYLLPQPHPKWML